MIGTVGCGYKAHVLPHDADSVICSQHFCPPLTILSFRYISLKYMFPAIIFVHGFVKQKIPYLKARLAGKIGGDIIWSIF